MNSLDSMINLFLLTGLDPIQDIASGRLMDVLGHPDSPSGVDVVEWAKTSVMPWLQAHRSRTGELGDFLTIGLRLNPEDGQFYGGPILVPMAIGSDKESYADAVRKFSAEMQMDWVVNCSEAWTRIVTTEEMGRKRFTRPFESPDRVSMLTVSVEMLGFSGMLMCPVRDDGTYGETSYIDKIEIAGAMTHLAGSSPFAEA